MSIADEIKAAVQIALHYRGDLFRGSNLVDAIGTVLTDAADAPGLRVQVAELQATVTNLTAQIAKLERDNKRLTADYKFYYEGFTGKQLRIAEDAWGLPGGG